MKENSLNLKSITIGQPIISIPFLIQGNLNNLTNPKSSPVTITPCWKFVSAALTSVVSVYFSQTPFTSAPITHVHDCQWMDSISSLRVTRFPAILLLLKKNN